MTDADNNDNINKTIDFIKNNSLPVHNDNNNNNLDNTYINDTNQNPKQQSTETQEFANWHTEVNA